MFHHWSNKRPWICYKRTWFAGWWNMFGFCWFQEIRKKHDEWENHLCNSSPNSNIMGGIYLHQGWKTRCKSNQNQRKSKVDYILFISKTDVKKSKISSFQFVGHFWFTFVLWTPSCWYILLYIHWDRIYW